MCTTKDGVKTDNLNWMPTVTDAMVAHSTQTSAKCEHKGNRSQGPWAGLASQESRKRGEGERDVRMEGRTPVYWGVMKETQLAILETQVDPLKTCSRAKHSHTRLNKPWLLCKYCPIAKRPQGGLRIATSSNTNSVWAINKRLLEPSIYNIYSPCINLSASKGSQYSGPVTNALTSMVLHDWAAQMASDITLCLKVIVVPWWLPVGTLVSLWKATLLLGWGVHGWIHLTNHQTFGSICSCQAGVAHLWRVHIRWRSKILQVMRFSLMSLWQVLVLNWLVWACMTNITQNVNRTMLILCIVSLCIHESCYSVRHWVV